MNVCQMSDRTVGHCRSLPGDCNPGRRGRMSVSLLHSRIAAMLEVVLSFFVLAAALVSAVLTVCHAMVYKRDPRSATAWVVAAFTIPIVGPLLYYFFGINRIQRQAQGWALPHTEPTLPETEAGEPHVADRSAEVCLAGPMHELATLGDRLNDRPLLAGNRITPLVNGETVFPAMLRAIASAERSVTLCTYIFDADVVGRSFVEALAAAAKRGAEVRVLVDGMGERYSAPTVSTLLKRAGVRHARFLPVRVPWPGSYVNLRNHRKILVADGRVAFVGGINISERHLADRVENARRVTDMHFQVEGPLVAHLQDAFVDDWAFVTGERLSGEAFYPPLAEVGDAVARLVLDGPDLRIDRLKWLILGALSCAREHVYIMTPYFIPDRGLVTAMGTAALRGVDVRLALPGTVDRPFVRWAARGFLWELLERGVRVFDRPPPFAHTKLMLVDGRWALIGSANLDPRSLRLNFESNVEVYGEAFAGELVSFFERAVASAEEVTLAQIDARPLPIRLRDGFAKLFGPFL